jgi:hypothetical protein
MPGTLLSVALLVVVCVAFSTLAWWAGRRWGSRALAIVWVAGSLAFAGAMTARVHQQQMALGLTGEQASLFPILGRFLLMVATALGFVTLLIRRRLRTPGRTFGVSTAALSVAAFLGGLLIFFLAYAAWDFAGLFAYP